MKLKNQDPRALIGRTIIFRGVAWRIDSVNDDDIELSKPGLDQKGRLRRDLFTQCSLFPSLDEIRTRFPKLLRALRTVCNLTTGESENALFGMIINGPFFSGSEALSHIGGAGHAVWLCWNHRTRVRESFAHYAQLQAA